MIRKRSRRPAELDAFGLGGCDPFRLPLPDVAALVLRNKGQNLKDYVAEKGPDQILASPGVQQRHVDDTDIDAFFFCKNSPLLENLGIVPAEPVDTLNIEKIVLFEPADQLSIFWPVKVLATLLVDVNVAIGYSILMHGN